MYDEKGIWISGNAQEDMFESIRANIYNLVTNDEDSECVNIMESILNTLHTIHYRMDNLKEESDNFRRRAIKAEVRVGKLEAEIKRLGGSVD